MIATLIQSAAIVSLLLLSHQLVSGANLRRSKSGSSVPKNELEHLSTLTPQSVNDNNSPCQLDLIEVCNLSYPTTYQGIFDARMCLWANREKVTQNCLQYLIHDSPSIIEPCYEPITNFCKDVTPGDNRVHTCLSEKAAGFLSDQCLQVVDRDFKWTQTANAKHRPSVAYEKDPEDDYASSETDDMREVPKDSAEEAAEYAYLMNKLHQRQSKSQVNSRDEVRSKLMEIVAFQDVLSSFSTLPFVQQIQDFLVHVNDELNLLEGFLLQVATQSTPENQEENGEDDYGIYSYYIDDDDEDTSPCNDLYNDDCGEDSVGDYEYLEEPASTAPPLASSSSSASTFPSLLSSVEMDEESEYLLHEDEQSGDHIFHQAEHASTLTTNDDAWRKDDSTTKVFAFPLPSTTNIATASLPLTSDSLLSVPRRVVQVMVQTTMAATNSLLTSPAAAATATTNSNNKSSHNNNDKHNKLRGSNTADASSSSGNYNSAFVESLRSMVQAALQDPRL